MIDLTRDGDVFTMTLNAGENRWNTTFVRAIDEVLNEVEASTGAAALVTTSADAKFFSNGLDLDWVQAPDDYPAAGDRKAFGPEFMGLMSRIMTFSMPTVCAVNGHAFGAGFMSALCHDVRFMRADRGFMCANELQIGLSIPSPELALFKHKLPASAFFETVQLASVSGFETATIAANGYFVINDNDALMDAGNDNTVSLIGDDGTTVVNSLVTSSAFNTDTESCTIDEDGDTPTPGAANVCAE